MASRFSRYRKEREGLPRPARVRKDPLAERITKEWEWMLGKPAEEGYQYESVVVSSLRRLRISARDVGRFVQSLPAFEDAERFNPLSGQFISALIALSWGKRFTIRLPDLDKPVDEFGFRNTKDVTVEGSLGELAGHWMRGGRLTIQGDVGAGAANRMEGGHLKVLGGARMCAGERMSGGTLEICGSAGDLVGDEMEDGLILVRGRAGGKIGMGMNGGRIELESGFAGLSDYFNDGEIYHKGLRIR